MGASHLIAVVSWSCLLVVLSSLTVVSQAQDSSCLNQLIPCVQYINSKAVPSSSCCNPLKALMKSDPRCLCSMLGGGGSKTRAHLLPGRCGEKVNATAMCSGSPKSKTSLSSSASGFHHVTMVMVATISMIISLCGVV